MEGVRKLKPEEGQDIRVAGSVTLVSTLRASGLIDEYRLLVHPILMGSGKRFFREEKESSRLRLVRTQTFSKGVVLLCSQPE